MKEDREGLDMLRRAIDRVAADLPEPDARLSARGRNRLHPALAAAAAAAVVAAILAYPAYLGTVRLPRLEAELGSSRGLSPGPVNFQWIPVPRTGLRGSSHAGEVEIRAPRQGADSGGLILLLDLDLRELEPKLGGSAVVEIHRADGSELGSWVLTPTQLATYRDRDEGLPLLLAADALAPGHYYLSVRSGGGGTDPQTPAAEPVAALELRILPSEGEGDGASEP